jgi:hypothetical protein
MQVLAIQRYYEVYRTVKPKEEKLKTANEALAVMHKSLARKQEMLKLVCQFIPLNSYFSLFFLLKR